MTFLSTTAAAIFLAAALLTGCSPGEAPLSEARSQLEAPTVAPVDVLLVTIDTARADRFSYVDPSNVKTPHVDAVATEGVGFLQAIAPTPLTLPSHSTILTGKNPTRHGVRSNGLFALSVEHRTLAEELSDNGYHSGAFVSAAILPASAGLDRGFAVYDDFRGKVTVAPKERPGNQTIRAALGWLSDQQGPVFLWVHLFEPHAPYAAPEPERSAYGDSYNAEVAYADRLVGQLVEGWRSQRDWARTLVIITSDHGESLMEHGEDSHAMFIYDATIRVPLVMKVPGMAGGQRIDVQVHLSDIMPTVLEVTKCGTLPDLDGLSLLPLLRGEPSSRDLVYIESKFPEVSYGWSPLRGLRSAERKLIVGAEPEVYDLVADPDELRPLELAADEVRALVQTLDDRYPDTPMEQYRELSQEEVASLRALGYVASPAVPSDSGMAPADPRTMIGLHNEVIELFKLYEQGKDQEVVARANRLLAVHPNTHFALIVAADAAVRMQDYTAVLNFTERALDLWEQDPDRLGNRAAALSMLGRHREAVEAYDYALQIGPDHSRNRYSRWGALVRLGETEMVRTEIARALAKDPMDEAALSIQKLLGPSLEGPAVPLGRTQRPRR
jgi:arylsulfatase A-like enzyme